MFYILKDKVPVKVTWAEYRAATRESPDIIRVARETVNGADVSTVFLGIDHRFSPECPPVLFETMVFGGPLDQEMDRCCTWDEAENMHERMCEKVRNADQEVNND